MSNYQQGYPPAGPAGPVPGMPPAPPAPQSTNGLSIAGLVLAFLVPPLGLILSIIGLVQAGRRNQKGKGLAIAGIILAVIFTGTGTAIAVAAGGKVSTLTDPGCTTAKSAILDNESKANNSSDVNTEKQGLQATADGLNAAASKAKHDNVRTAVKALADDYTELLNDLNSGTVPPQDFLDKLTTDGGNVDKYCSIGLN